jgi:hypothetical protein
MVYCGIRTHVEKDGMVEPCHWDCHKHSAYCWRASQFTGKEIAPAISFFFQFRREIGSIAPHWADIVGCW